MIEHMNDEEKSVALAKVTGLEVRDWHIKQFIRTPEGQIIEADLYLPANMALAWWVHIWMLDNLDAVGSWKYVSWWENLAIFGEKDAQRLWLDKGLSLATGFELAEVNDAS